MFSQNTDNVKPSSQSSSINLIARHKLHYSEYQQIYSLTEARKSFNNARAAFQTAQELNQLHDTFYLRQLQRITNETCELFLSQAPSSDSRVHGRIFEALNNLENATLDMQDLVLDSRKRKRKWPFESQPSHYWPRWARYTEAPTDNAIDSDDDWSDIPITPFTSRTGSIASSGHDTVDIPPTSQWEQQGLGDFVHNIGSIAENLNYATDGMAISTENLATITNHLKNFANDVAFNTQHHLESAVLYLIQFLRSPTLIDKLLIFAHIALKFVPSSISLSSIISYITQKYPLQVRKGAEGAQATQSEYVQQGLEENLVPLAGGIVVLAFGVVYSFLPSESESAKHLKKFSSKMSDFSKISGGITGLISLYTKCCELLQAALSYFFEECNPKYRVAKEYADKCSGIRDWYVNVMNLDREQVKIMSTFDMALRDRIGSLRDQGLAFHKIIDTVEQRDMTIKQHFNQAYLKIITIYNEMIRISFQSESRIDPFCVALYGKGGIGKSFIITKLCKEVATVCGVPPYRQIFARSSEKYWTNYAHQFAVVIDDFMLMRETQVDYDPVAEFCSIKSNTPYQVNLASVTEKGRQFTSEFIGMTTNVPYPRPNGCQHLPALWRRRNLLVEVDSSVQALDVEPGSTDHLTFYLRDPLSETSSRGEPMSYDAFKSLLIQRATAYLERQRQSLEAMGEPLHLPAQMDPRNSDLFEQHGSFNRVCFDARNEDVAPFPPHFCDIEKKVLKHTTTFRTILQYWTQLKKLLRSWDHAIMINDGTADACRAMFEQASGVSEVNPTRLINYVLNRYSWWEARYIRVLHSKEFPMVGSYCPLAKIRGYHGPNTELDIPTWQLESELARSIEMGNPTEWVRDNWHSGVPCDHVGLRWTYKMLFWPSERSIVQEGWWGQSGLPEPPEGLLTLQVLYEYLLDPSEINMATVRSVYPNFNFGVDVKALYLLFLKINKLETAPVAKQGDTLQSSCIAYFKGVVGFFKSNPILTLIGVLGSAIAALGIINLGKYIFGSEGSKLSQEGVAAYHVDQLKSARRAGKRMRIQRQAFREAIQEGSTDPNCHDLIQQRISRAIVVVEFPDIPYSQNFINYSGRFLVGNNHAFDKVSEGDRMHFYLGDGSVCIKDVFEKRRLVRDSKNDIAVYVASPKFPLGKNNLMHFLKDSDLEFVYPTDAIIVARQPSTMMLNQLIVEATPLSDLGVDIINSAGVPYRYNTGWSYRAQSTPGMCGAPLCIANSRFPRKIVGMHTLGNKNGFDCYANLLTQEHLLEMMSVLPSEFRWETSFKASEMEPPIDVSPGSVDAFADEFLQEGAGFSVAGCVREKVATQSRTAIRQSPIFSCIYAPVTEPAVLSPYDKRKEDPSHPLVKAVRKYREPVERFRVEDIRVASDALHSEVLAMKPVGDARVEPLSVAINGDPTREFYDRIDMSTSPGLPYTKHRKGNDSGKSHLFTERVVQRRDNIDEIEHTIADNVAGRLLQSRIAQRLDGYSRGEQANTCWTDCLKDERRPTEKIRLGKTRSFCIAPVDYTIVCRMYFMAFTAAFYSSCVKSFSAVGIDCESPQWTALYRKLRTKGRRGFDGDFGQYDGKAVQADLVDELCEMINSWYRKWDPTWSPHDDAVRKLLIDEAMHTTVLIGNVLYMKHQGNPSGNPLTVVINTMCNALLMRIAYRNIMREAGRDDLIQLRVFAQRVAEIYYGDDNAITSDDEILTHFNFSTVSEFFARYGIEYLNARKTTDNIPTVPLIDFTFLKRRFVPHPSRPEVVLAPIAKETIQELTNWVRNSGDVKEQIRENCLNALNFAYHYGFNYWDKLHREINTSLVNEGITPVIASFTEMEDAFMRKFL